MGSLLGSGEVTDTAGSGGFSETEARMEGTGIIDEDRFFVLEGNSSRRKGEESVVEAEDAIFYGKGEGYCYYIYRER